MSMDIQSVKCLLKEARAKKISVEKALQQLKVKIAKKKGNSPPPFLADAIGWAGTRLRVRPWK